MSSRRSTYKLPPASSSITSTVISQAARREKALSDQKRKRALRFELSRNISSSLDAFADLNIDEEDETDKDIDEDSISHPDGLKVVHGGLASFTSELSEQSEKPSKKKKKIKSKPSKGKNHVKSSPSTNAQWTDKCMYAELLEMSESKSMDIDSDLLPIDLHTSWVALSPVPVGKRCLAITREGPGKFFSTERPASTISLRSRLLGKPLLNYFPSTLPPNTILDCILDANWRTNGILHVLDVLRWKGQEVGDCEAGMRFWWRDTRLAELSSLPPPSKSSKSSPSSPSSTYTYPYPTTLLSVPYHPSPLTLPTLLNVIVPAARNIRLIDVLTPAPSLPPSAPADSSGMDVELSSPTSVPHTTSHQVHPDGLLLYLAEASYESGTSPLSSWVPLHGYDDASDPSTDASEEPMNLFERLLRRRVQQSGRDVEIGTDVYSGMDL